MSKLNAGAAWKSWLGAAVLGTLLSACGNNAHPTVRGLAQADGPVVGQVSLLDSSAVPVRRTALTAADGTFAVDVAGLTPPFLVKVQAASGTSGNARLFTAATDAGRADVNPVTSAAFSGAAEASGEQDDDAFEHQGGEQHQQTAGRVLQLLTQLKTALAPLFTLYGITDPTVDRAQVRLLLADVSFQVRSGTLTVTNRATGAVIFSGPLADLASGTFHPEAMPPGPGTTPPPTGEGATLYEVNCTSCHGPLATSQVHGATASEIQGAIRENEGGMGALSALTPAQLQAISAALAGSSGGGGGGGGPGACTYTYSAYGACTNGTQTRTVLSATPAGCTGTPVLSQSCSTTPPPPDGAALYTTYCSGCHGNGKKGRSVSAIQNAIANNTGGMGSAALRALTPAQIAAISAAP